MFIIILINFITINNKFYNNNNKQINSPFRNWESPEELLEQKKKQIKKNQERDDSDAWELYGPWADYWKLNFLKNHTNPYFIVLFLVSNLNNFFLDRKKGLVPHSPCFFKFIQKDFFLRKSFFKIITFFFSFVKLIFFKNTVFFFTLLIIIGVAERRLEGLDFATSQKEWFYWYSGLVKLPVEKWYV